MANQKCVSVQSSSGQSLRLVGLATCPQWRRSILEAIDLESPYQISFWDALVIHAAQTAGVEVVYSEDLSDGQRYGGVLVRNQLTGPASR